MSYTGDPLQDFTLIRFLDRFVFKNPKKKEACKLRTRNEQSAYMAKYFNDFYSPGLKASRNGIVHPSVGPFVSAPEPKAQVHYCDHTLSIVRRPSVRPSLTFTFSTSPLKPLNRIQRNLSASKISMSSTKFVFFRLIGKTRWPPRALIGWDTFDFFSETTEGNAKKLDMKQDLNVLYHVCVFRADRKTKMAAPASDWLRHYWLLLWNRWTEWEETQQEARS